MHPLEKFKYCPACGSKHFERNSEKSKKCDNCGFEYFINPSAACVAFIMNEQGQLLIERRKHEPAKDMLDLPGGFSDMGETSLDSVKREVEEETGLKVTSAEYLFSLPNVYRYSDMDIPTLDMFYLCKVEDTACLHAADDASECMWMKPEDIRTELFGLRSVRHGLSDFLRQHLGIAPETSVEP